MVRSTLVGILFVLLLALVFSQPAAGEPTPPAPSPSALLHSLAEPVPIDWESMTPVSEWVAAREAALKPKPQPKPRQVAKKPQSSQATKGNGVRWTTAQIRARLTQACEKYGVSPDWIVGVGTRIASRESGGRVSVVNSSGHAGLFQFSNAWGNLKYRTDPDWSCERFIKVYAAGGEAKIRQHWKATIN